MNTYRVYFRSDLQWGREDIEADTPAEALAMARKLAGDMIDLDHFYEPADSPINEIEVCDDEHDLLAAWRDDDLRLRLAARDLLDALEALCDLRPDEAGDTIIPTCLLKQGRAAIAEAKGGEP